MLNTSFYSTYQAECNQRTIFNNCISSGSQVIFFKSKDTWDGAAVEGICFLNLGLGDVVLFGNGVVISNLVA